MPSSISSSEVRPLDSARSRALLLGMIVGMLGLILVEAAMRYNGATPGVKDNPGLWSLKRSQASRFGKEAIILVGSSRIQLGVDVERLEALSERPVVQLAIDGSFLLDVLEDLAADPQVRGDIIVTGSLPKLSHSPAGDISQKWLAHYHHAFRGLVFPKLEQRLKTELQSLSAIYANLIPLDVLVTRLWQRQELPKIYLRTLPSRDRDADYSLVEQPDFYVRRVLQVLGRKIPDTAFQSPESFSDAVLESSRQNIRAINSNESRYRRAESAIATLQARGSRVSIVRFPTSGLVRAIEDLREPITTWREVTQRLHPAASIDFRDHKELQYRLADGSHLDQHQKVEFTERLIALLKRHGGLGPALVNAQEN